MWGLRGEQGAQKPRRLWWWMVSAQHGVGHLPVCRVAVVPAQSRSVSRCCGEIQQSKVWISVLS